MECIFGNNLSQGKKKPEPRLGIPASLACDWDLDRGDFAGGMDELTAMK
jgi:hypothetical protein